MAKKANAQVIEEWPIDKLIEYARNPRKNDHAVDKIASAIREFGFRVPILAKSDGSMIDGHLRLKAARKLGMDTVPVLLADDMTDAQVKAFRLSVNKMSELAEWDEELLALEFAELEEMEFDLELTGFDLDEIKGDTEKYTMKTDVFTYEPTGDKPALNALFDDKKTNKLIEEIKKSNLDEAEKYFLTMAAYRHTVFNFEKIANYYAHSGKDVQSLMENSALVIIDFEDAIAGGFVNLTKKLKKLIEKNG
jgi:ParB-like chromosome segregation protein Spo0J